MNRKKRGFTLIELLVVIAIIALLIGLLLPALAKAQRNARTLKDKSQVKQIHQSFLIFAEGNRDKLPIPGLINRFAVEHLPGQPEVPGMGKEDWSINSTDNLYSAMIAQQYFSPQLVVGPTEVNEIVQVYSEYNYDEYDPSSDVYWDEEFTADIGGAELGDSNASYAHLAICGERKRLKWRNTQEQGDPIVSTRGPDHGALTGNAYTFSPTLQLHGGERMWVGNIVFNDNHAETLEVFYPPLTTYEKKNGVGLEKDNIFDSEFNDFEPDNGEASNDAFLVMCVGLTTETTVDEKYDVLLSGAVP